MKKKTTLKYYLPKHFLRNIIKFLVEFKRQNIITRQKSSNAINCKSKLNYTILQIITPFSKNTFNRNIILLYQNF